MFGIQPALSVYLLLDIYEVKDWGAPYLSVDWLGG